jgi:hypothetical protein
MTGHNSAYPPLPPKLDLASSREATAGSLTLADEHGVENGRLHAGNQLASLCVLVPRLIMSVVGLVVNQLGPKNSHVRRVNNIKETGQSKQTYG